MNFPYISLFVRSIESLFNVKKLKVRAKYKKPDVELLENKIVLISYVDIDNDGVFNSSVGDVALVNGELSDGVFSTRIPEGPDYISPLSGAGLVIDEVINTKSDVSLIADGNIVLLKNISTSKNLFISSGIFTNLTTGKLQFSNISFNIKGNVRINANSVDGSDLSLILGGSFFLLSQSDAVLLRLNVTQSRNVNTSFVINSEHGNVNVSSSRITGKFDIVIRAEMSLDLNPTIIKEVNANDSVFNTTSSKDGGIQIEGINIQLDNSQLIAGQRIFINANQKVLARNTLLRSNNREIVRGSPTGAIAIRAQVLLDLNSSVLIGYNVISIIIQEFPNSTGTSTGTHPGSISLINALIGILFPSKKGRIGITSGTVDVTNAEVVAPILPEVIHNISGTPKTIRVGTIRL